MKYIKLMPDYQCFPIWDMTPGAYGDLDPKILPISEALQTQIMNWARLYEETLNLDNPMNSGFKTSDAKNAFEMEGMRLAERLQKELGAQFGVELDARAFMKAGDA